MRTFEFMRVFEKNAKPVSDAADKFQAGRSIRVMISLEICIGVRLAPMLGEVNLPFKIIHEPGSVSS